MQLYRESLHFNGNNKPVRFENLFIFIFAPTHHQLGGRVAAPGTSVQRRLRQKVSRRSPVPKSVNCAQLLREGYITHNILPLQRLISGGRVGKKKVKPFLKRSSISQLQWEAAIHTSVPAVVSHQPGHTGETRTAHYQRLMGCPS